MCPTDEHCEIHVFTSEFNHLSIASPFRPTNHLSIPSAAAQFRQQRCPSPLQPLVWWLAQQTVQATGPGPADIVFLPSTRYCVHVIHDHTSDSATNRRTLSELSRTIPAPKFTKSVVLQPIQ
jgi:hypothetical protein